MPGTTWARDAIAELDRLRRPDRPRVPVAAAVAVSVVVVGLGNGVVALGRRWCEPEWTTLIGVPVIGLLGALLLRVSGWDRRGLGLQAPALEPHGPAAQLLFRVAVFLALGSAALTLLIRDRVTPLDVARLLIGTAIGEELVHRGVVLAVWAGTRLGAWWVVPANALTFALWHVAGATHDDGLHWLEVLGPGLLALPLVWARLRFRSVLAPAAFHGAANMTLTLLSSDSAATCLPRCGCAP